MTEMDNEQYEYKRTIKTTDEQLAVLEQFTPEQQDVIIERLKVLSVIPKIIGRDFDMPVELNKPNGGWHWDFKANIVRVDPVDLLEKPIDYLRFVMAHEGGHRRISRTDFIPPEVWKQRGFPFLVNVIEDPRDNNFLAEAYPRFREEASVAYDINNALAEKMKTEAKEKLGTIPRFQLAGHEFIRLWYSWFQKDKMIVDDRLPAEVQDVVKKALVSAEDAWSRYPSKVETDGEKSQETIRAFAKVSYDIILEEIWPEFQKLVKTDLEDQKLEEYLKQLEKEKQEKREKDQTGESDKGEDGSLESGLTKEEQEELEKALDESTKDNNKQEGQDGESAGSGEGQESESSSETPNQESDDKKSSGGKPIPLDSLSTELKEKLRQKIASLSDEEKDKLQEKAEKALGEFEQSINKELEGKLSENPEQKEEREKSEKAEGEKEDSEKTEKLDGENKGDIKGKKKGAESDEKSEEEIKQEKEREEKHKKEIDKVRSELEKITQGDKTVYENNRREVQPIINHLTNELRNIFRKRRENKYEAGRKSGRHIDIATRIKEIAKGVASFDSRAWMRKEAPQEKDYAFTLLVDLSGSMRGRKIAETFKATIALTEVLTQLGIKTEILGFNNKIHEFLAFNKKLSKDVRDKMSTMLGEVSSSRADYNDDGWAVEEASKRLAQQEEIEKIMIVLSDGTPEESSVHSGEEYELKGVIDKIVSKGKEKVIGLGIGPNTKHVSHYYPYSIADVSVEEMSKQLAELIVKVIEGDNNI